MTSFSRQVLVLCGPLVIGAAMWCGVAAVRGEAQARSRATAAEAEGDSQPSEAARGHFRRYCARCHGDDLRGSEWRAQGRRIPDFTDGPWQNSHSDTQLLVSVLEGKGSHMPPFRDKLSTAEAQAVVHFIRTANPTPARRPAAVEATDFDRRYDALQQELNDLRKEYRKLAPPSGPNPPQR
jgi:mono/diheme cytochrome c family protein